MQNQTVTGKKNVIQRQNQKSLPIITQKRITPKIFKTRKEDKLDLILHNKNELKLLKKKHYKKLQQLQMEYLNQRFPKKLNQPAIMINYS